MPFLRDFYVYYCAPAGFRQIMLPYGISSKNRMRACFMRPRKPRRGVLNALRYLCAWEYF